VLLLLTVPSRATLMPCGDVQLGGAEDAATGSVTVLAAGAVGQSSAANVQLVAGPLVCVAKHTVATGNCDDDAVIDQADWACMEACMEGPVLPVSLDCLIFDFDADGDVDFDDVAKFMQIYEG
jgi:(2Fe-2S) ferredoxin